MKDLCDETWDELYGAEYGMSDKRPCEPMYSFFCNGWNKCEEKLKCCCNCKHYRWSNGEDWCDDHYGQPMYDEECKDKWELR